MGGKGNESTSAFLGQHPVHRRVVQAQDVDGKDHARMRQEAAQDDGRGVSRVPMQVQNYTNYPRRPLKAPPVNPRTTLFSVL